MSNLLDRPIAASHPLTTTTAARRLRSTVAAVRLSFVWFGVRKTLTSQQKAQAAESFGAEGAFLSAGKKLIDTRDSTFQAVTGIRSRLVHLWKAMSLPYPEPGVRLIRQHEVQLFTVQATTLKAELEEAVSRLDEHFAELKEAARERLGSLYSDADYPQSLQGLFRAEWDFPSVEPPDYLRELSPELFRQEQSRVAARFEEAVRLAEDAFINELGSLVSHLTERLSGTEDGKPKVFRDSVVENLTEFFQRFRALNIGSSEQLDDLVEQAQQITRGVEPRQLRENADLRQEVATQLAGVQSVLDGLLVDRPRRRIIRSGIARESS
jgi:hypothetical protein